MRNLILALCLALPSHAAIARIGSVKTTLGTTSSSVDTTGASLIVVGCSSYQAACAGFTDSQSNSYTQLTRRTDGDNNFTWYYKCGPSTSASHTWTATNSAFPVIFIQVYSGTATSSCFDVESTAAGTAAGGLASTITPSQANSLIITGVADVVTDTRTVSANLSATANKLLEHNQASAMSGASGDILDYAGTSTITITWTQTVNTILISNAVFKPSSGVPAVVRHKVISN